MKDYVHFKEQTEAKQGDPLASATLHPEGSGHHTSPRQVLSHQLRLPPFSGDAKHDTTYELWKYEATCLRKEHHSPQIVLQAIRRSLKNEAANVVMRLGPEATIDDIIHKLDSCYGEVEQPEMLLAKFYSARQHKDETVSSWGCRLEELLSKAVEQGKVNASDTDNMLRVMFWSGLCDDLKDITGHLYERISDFDQLRVAIRRVEQDHRHRREDQPSSGKKSTTCKPAIAEDQLGDIKGMIHQLSTEMKAMKVDQQEIQRQLSNPTPSQQRNRNKGQQRQYSQQYQQGSGRQQQQHDRQSHGMDEADREPRHSNQDTRDISDAIICWRCGQEGHISLGCRVRLDHRRKPLNYGRPMTRGRH